jgi:hypothetical protein
MSLDELRQQMEEYRLDAEREGRAFKDPYITLDRLHELYRRLDSAERDMANIVIAEWALSDVERVRFEALTLVDEFHIVGATNALETLAARLASEKSPGAPFELKKVTQILNELSRAS